MSTTPATSIPPHRPSWQRLSDALVVLITHESDELKAYLLRVELLKARYTPWRKKAK